MSEMRTTFLSHNSQDKSLVEKIGYKLLSNGIKPWLDKWNLIPGDPWQEAIEEVLDECDSCVVFIGENGVGPWQNEEMRVAIQRRVEDSSKKFKVIPVLLPNAKKVVNIPTFLKRATWVQFHDSVDEKIPFDLLLHGINGTTPYPDGKKTLNISDFKNEIQNIYKLLGGELIETDYCSTDKFCVNFHKGPFSFLVHIICYISLEEDGELLEKNIKDIFIELSSYYTILNPEKVIVVSNVRASANALAFAKTKRITIIKKESLLNQLVNFTSYVEENIKEFLESDLGKYYISQTGSDIEDYESIKLSSFDEYLHRPLSNYVDDLFFKHKKRRIALLGNFGVGKTSFCKFYFYHLLLQYKEDSSRRIPVYLNLKEFRSGLDIHQVLTNHLQRQPGIDLSYNLFLELQRLGRFIFILDSLDEMATKVDRIVINENLRELDRLSEDGNNLYLISCRTHFFHEKISEDILEDYEVVFLTEWGRTELVEYMKKRFSDDWESQLNKFDNIKGLSELSTTPMFLEMILRSLSELDENEVIDLTKLYRSYTNDWIIKQSKRRGSVMSASQRESFTKTMAELLFIENKSELHFSELHKIAQNISGYKDATRIDYFDTDARTSTFITKSSEGFYGFRHRSFLEYFCSQAIVSAIEKEDGNLLSLRSIPKEILIFLEGTTISSTGVQILQNWTLDFKSKVKSLNSVAILQIKKESLKEEVIRHYSIQNSEWELLENSKVDEKALEVFYKKYYTELLALGMKYAGDYNLVPEDVEDSIQELMLRIWQDQDQSRLERFSVKSYLYSSLRNILLQRVKLKNRSITLSLDNEYVLENLIDHSSTESNDFGDWSPEILERIEYLVNNELNEKAKLVIQYSLFQRLPNNEIATKLDLEGREEVIRGIRYRALKQLRNLISKDPIIRKLIEKDTI